MSEQGIVGNAFGGRLKGEAGWPEGRHESSAMRSSGIDAMPLCSHTRLSTFERCPRRYYYRDVRRVPADTESIEAFTGKVVHEAFRKLYGDRMRGKILTRAELLDFYDAEWNIRFHDGVAIARRDHAPEHYRAGGAECLARYHALRFPFDRTTTLAVERRLTIALDDGGRHRLQGVVDRLAKRSDGAYEIHDYKTDSRLPGQREIDADRQLALYEIGVRQMWPAIDRIQLVWHYLRHDVEMRSSRTEDELKRLRDETVTLIEDIESRRDESDFRTNEGAHCDWCPFTGVCPARRHLVKTGELPTDLLGNEPGVRLADRHAQLTAEIEALEERIADLDAERRRTAEALLAYARREDLEIVAGTEYEAIVRQTPKLKLPRKTHEPEEYRRLDEVLRESDVWRAVSTVDVATLRRIWKGDEPDPGRVRKIIEPFVAEETVTAIHFRWRKDGRGPNRTS